MELVFSGTELDEQEPITALITAARRNEVRWIELWYPKNLRLEGRTQTIARLKEAEIRVACVSSGTELAKRGDVTNDQQMLIEAIELAHELGAPFANTYFGYLEKQDDDEAIRIYCDNLAPCLARAIDLGVTIVLENEFDAFGWDSSGSDITRRPEAMCRLVEQIDNLHFRLTFDACNAYFAGVEPFPAAYDMLRPYIAFVHVKDGHRVTQGQRVQRGWKTFADSGVEYATCQLGEGEIDWVGLVRCLVANNYKGFVSLEPHSEMDQRSVAWDHASKTFRKWLLDAEKTKNEDVGFPTCETRRD